MSQKKTHVLKFGGSSLSNKKLLLQVVSIIQEHKKEADDVLVVVSARGKSTDHLLQDASDLSPNVFEDSHRRELDMLLSVGERISMALLSMALKDAGVESISFTGSQSGIMTNEEHGRAKIVKINAPRILDSLEKGLCVIVAGFQGVSESSKEITTLGRGGSDTTAVALAQYLNCSEVFLYSDVSGYYSADPRVCSEAELIQEGISWPMAYEISHNGAKVLHPRAVQLAWQNKISLNCLSTACPRVDNTRISGEIFQGLENTQFINISSSGPLTQLKICAKPVHNSEKSHRLENKLFSDSVDYHYHDNGDTSLWLDSSKKTPLEAETKELQKEEGCRKISLNGYHVRQSPFLIQKFFDCFEAKNILMKKVNDLSLSVYLKDTSEEQCKSYVRKLHQDFIVKNGSPSS